MRLSLAGAIGATILTVCATTGIAGAAPSSQDKTLVTKAAQGGAAEVAGAKLALSKKATPQAKMIAERMERDHAKADDKLASIAESEGLKVPGWPEIVNEPQTLKERVLSRSSFSAAYLHDQRTAHQQTIALFKREIAAGQDPRIVAFAKRPSQRLRGISQ